MVCLYTLFAFYTVAATEEALPIELSWYKEEDGDDFRFMYRPGIINAIYDPEHPVPSHFTPLDDAIIWFRFEIKHHTPVQLYLHLRAQIPDFYLELNTPVRASIEPFSVKFNNITKGYLCPIVTKDNIFECSLDPLKDGTFTPYLRVSGKNNCVTIAFDVSPGVTKSTTIDFLALAKTPF